VHGVQHVFHPPSALPEWPVDPDTGHPDRRTRLVFITRDLGEAMVRRVLSTALELGPAG
jgi:G3E family GTPase